MPEPGRSDVPYWVSTEAEARKAVQELAANKVDIVKIWVDDRDGKYKKMPPEIYGPIIDEAHKQGLRVTAHIFNLSDAKGLLKAGLDAFAHGVRDVDIDEEFLGMAKQRRALVLVPNLPDRGVETDLSWLKDSVPAAELAKLQAARRSRQPDRAAGLRHPGPQPREDERRGCARGARHRRRRAVGAPPGDGRHGGGRDDARPGHRGLHAATPPSSCG